MCRVLEPEPAVQAQEKGNASFFLYEFKTYAFANISCNCSHVRFKRSIKDIKCQVMKIVIFFFSLHDVLCNPNSKGDHMVYIHCYYELIQDSFTCCNLSYVRFNQSDIIYMPYCTSRRSIRRKR